MFKQRSVKGGHYLRLSITPFIGFLPLLGAVVSAACGDGSAGITPAASPAPAATAMPLVPLQTSATAALAGNPNSVVLVGGAAFKVELAITQEQRTQGLSGRASLAPGAGMLFVFDEAGRYSFWMKEMRFPLDLIWVDARCTVVDITSGAPPPVPGQSASGGPSELPLYTPVTPVQYVLEVNGGETEAVGIRVGDRVEFKGSLAGLYGC